MMVRVELDTWPGGLKLFREALLKTGDRRLQNQPKDHLVKTCLEDQLSDESRTNCPQTALTEDECNEAISLMKHSADEDTVKKKMKLKFVYRRNMVLDPQQSSNILSDFPHFKDVKGLEIIYHYFENMTVE
ncbi:hypothetical protein N1851_027158 [Merluccius polli]|uniref:Uncharacterized protein n=1 Tax=Merluccius polli TaxID=89951 RepID=A0AA47NTD4_MERPO|nr:hypothetical protein N1851_027158 [Merluccius polli]